MRQTAPECPKCRTAMDPGIMLDRGDHNYLNTVEWLEGKAEKSFWTGLKTKGKERLPVQTWRCSRCGYLESYAIEKSGG